MPLLDQAGEAQTSSRSLENSEPGDASAGSHDATVRIHDPDSSSKTSTQHSSAKRHIPLSPLPLNDGISGRNQEDHNSAIVTRSNTPELQRVTDKQPGMAIREMSVHSQSLGMGSSGSQGQAAFEQAGKFRTGGMDRLRNLGRREEAREHARKNFAAAILRRFNAKLEGLTERSAAYGEGRRVVALSVEEQVEKLLLQASSTENLAQMYEGWTPWI